MFFQPTLNSHWFFVRKTSQYLMLILASTMLFIPLLYLPEEGETEPVSLTLIALGITAAGVAVTIWIYNDGICDECNNGRESDHLKECTNCHIKAFVCPGYPHGHKQQCGYCKDWYFCCEYGNNNEELAAEHGLERCTVPSCGKRYRKCTEEDQHGPGKCDDGGDTIILWGSGDVGSDDEHRSNNSSGNNSSGNNSSSNNSSS